MNFFKCWNLEWKRHRLFIVASYLVYAVVKAGLLGMNYRAWKGFLGHMAVKGAGAIPYKGMTMIGLDLLIIGFVGAFSLYIWLVDWYGKGHFATRWMLFPLKRFDMYLAKWATSILFFLGFLMIDLGEVLVYYLCLKGILPHYQGYILRFSQLFGLNAGGVQAGSLFLQIQWQVTLLLFLLASLSILLAFDLLIFGKSLRPLGKIILGLGLLALCLVPILELVPNITLFPKFLSYETILKLIVANALAIVCGSYLSKHRIAI